MSERFEIHVDDAVLDDLRERLSRTRWPDMLDDVGWTYGTPRAFLQELCDYWLHEYDWRAAENRLNQYEHHLTTIDGEQVHYLHARSPHPGALPLIMTHGWPGSIVEFMDVIGPLVDPPAHGGDAADAFHVVCPSIPGYAWSGPTRQTGWHIIRVAAALQALMAELGYDRYGVQGGDWGAMASLYIALEDAAHVVGLHLNIAMARPPGRPDDFEGLSESEQADWDEFLRFQIDGTGYSSIQGTRPQTLAYGLTDSPAALAGWIVDKFYSWSDCGGDVESVFSKDELLTNIMTYWVTGTAGSSTRLYRETMHAGLYGAADRRIEVPTGMAIFPKEMLRPPRKWVEHGFNLQRWTVMPKGGHFAAFEQPELFVNDVRAFFRELR
jgi:microsomal epoxide hydrolase